MIQSSTPAKKEASMATSLASLAYRITKSSTSSCPAVRTGSMLYRLVTLKYRNKKTRVKTRKKKGGDECCYYSIRR